jgi:hypothetical protein
VNYVLCRVLNVAGKPRLVFSREPRGEVVDHVPEGYEIVESINGVVSLARIKEVPLLESEVRTIQDLLRKRSHTRHCETRAKGVTITIYEPSSWGDFTPVLRFILTNPEAREFEVQRMIFRGVTRWSYPLDYGPLARIAKEPIAVLGTDDFYDLG